MKSERYVPYNCNPKSAKVGDCVVRAICTALNRPWGEVYMGICAKGYELCDMPSADHVWSAYLVEQGLRRELVRDDLLPIYTVDGFCRDHPKGTYILAISGHVVCVIDGCYYDSWDSGNEIPIYYWHKEE